jgi:hypothetical protein
VTELDPELGQRLSVRFEVLAAPVEQGLRNGGTEELIRRGEELVGETIAFVGGAATRQLDLDGGITSLALAWLDALSTKGDLPKVGVVIPASTEFTGMLTQVIRLRLPSDGIWGLPVAVHEYGHFIASVLTRREARGDLQTTIVPIEELAHGTASEADFPRLYWHGHELFADALAAATAGPAYTRYCVHHRFDPSEAQTVTATHPEPARRIHMQLAALCHIASGDREPLYLIDEATKLGAAWDDAVEAAGADPGVRFDAHLDPLEQKVLELLDDDRLTAIRYREHLDARTLAESPLADADHVGSVAQALNAAWGRRLRNGAPESIEDIATECERLVRKVLGRG